MSTTNAAAGFIGLNETQEPKYGFCPSSGLLYNRDTGVKIHPSEPIFIFRARDKKAILALVAYRDSCIYDTHKEAVGIRIKQFRNWMDEHPDLVREADTDVTQAFRNIRAWNEGRASGEQEIQEYFKKAEDWEVASLASIVGTSEKGDGCGAGVVLPEVNPVLPKVPAVEDVRDDVLCQINKAIQVGDALKASQFVGVLLDLEGIKGSRGDRASMTATETAEASDIRIEPRYVSENREWQKTIQKLIEQWIARGTMGGNDLEVRKAALELALMIRQAATSPIRYGVRQKLEEVGTGSRNPDSLTAITPLLTEARMWLEEDSREFMKRVADQGPVREG